MLLICESIMVEVGLPLCEWMKLFLNSEMIRIRGGDM